MILSDFHVKLDDFCEFKQRTGNARMLNGYCHRLIPPQLMKKPFHPGSGLSNDTFSFDFMINPR
jgi:hypothetical protein